MRQPRHGILDGLPQLARSPELAEVARSLAPVAPLALPIGQKSATDRMQDADAALQRLDQVQRRCVLHRQRERVPAVGDPRLALVLVLELVGPRDGVHHLRVTTA